MLEKQNMNNLKSESLHFPNVGTLMKISLGLIIFTMISTVLVYGQTSEISTVQISENAYDQKNSNFVDNPLFSSSPGTTITVVNNDIVSHKLVSGVSNSNNAGLVANYDDFLICELNEKVKPTSNNYGSDDNLCDFNKDNRIITDIIPPGESISFSLIDEGTYRIIDPDYPWIEFVIYSFPDSNSSNNINSGFLDEERNPQQTASTESESVTAIVETLSVTVDGMPFDVNFSTIGLNVYEIESDTDSMSLIFYVDVNSSNGKLEVTFDREFFDSVYDGIDDQFFILSDGDETIFKEIQTTSESRTLSIDVSLGVEELEIIGSEFGFSKVISVPVIETPVIETPVIETPVIETPVVEIIPTNECGPGTVLENNVCVLDERCGPGTVLENNVCVLDSSNVNNSPTVSNTSSPSSNKEMIMSFSVAFGIAGVIGIILALIAKAHKKK
ncbi:MAG: hypothetical protein HPQ69_01660 [Marine Group I thaumarchaeote]|nr:MAG: hypothetical protein HPQ69_01660 [Marine Group I thaumarchaeote]